MSESILFQQNILVVNQKAKLIELTNQYSVFDANGNTVGHVNQVGQSNVKKLLRLVSSVDQFLTHHFDITDSSGALVMSITRPAKIFKSTVLINDSTGAELGRIVQENVFGKIHFALEVGGSKIGAIKAENKVSASTPSSARLRPPKPSAVSGRQATAIHPNSLGISSTNIVAPNRRAASSGSITCQTG